MRESIFTAALAAAFAQACWSADAVRPAPDYTVMLPGGREVKLGDYRGKVLSLAFILTT
ncbi:MAG: hypothetical protein HY235_02575 [Acidobacteria bacterium]|nr:hypothetical protein [Acidobacteriota bacterium]